DRWTARTFSMLDLQLPSNPRYYTYILTSIVRQSTRKENKNTKPLQALKSSLIWDFLFMIGIYSFIALLALHISILGIISSKFFIFLAIIQGIAWILDITENVIIWRSTYKPKMFIKTMRNVQCDLYDDEQEGTKIYFFYIWVVRLKFLIGILGFTLPFLTILFIYFFKNFYSDVSAIKGILTFVCTFLVLILGLSLGRTSKANLSV
ncbi:MAG: hypothetical protein WAT92_06650, partial [Saprospiraceae bacterium]